MRILDSFSFGKRKLVKTRKQRTGIPIANTMIVMAVSVVIGGCTMGSVNDLTGSSTHSAVSTVPAQQSEPVQQAAIEPVKQPLPGVQTNPNNLQTASLETSGTQAKNSIATRSLIQPGETIPVTQPQMASLSTSTNFALSGSDAMAYADPLLPVTQAPNSLDPESLDLESSAQQRAEILYSQMTHGACKSGWATPPDKLDALRTTPGHPYYMEMRLRNTPLFPVGHTYIAYGRLSPEGKPLDEKLIMLSPLGGYGGAAIAAALPMPGILTPLPDDCRIKPIAAYRVTLDAQNFEKLLLSIQAVQKKIPAYSLFAYNCNNFVSDITAPVGILPAKSRYLSALKYIYSVIEVNEGYNPKKQQRS